METFHNRLKKRKSFRHMITVLSYSGFVSRYESLIMDQLSALLKEKMFDLLSVSIL